MTQFPVLDLEPYFSGAPGAAARLADELRHAQEDVGFYCIVNHGVARATIPDAFAAIAEFFALPPGEKLKVRARNNMLGYLPVESTVYRTSKYNENTEKDMNETILLVREDNPERDVSDWPANPPGFRAALTRYQNEMEALALRLVPLYALALGLGRDFFDEAFREPGFVCRCSRYPKVDLAPNQFGIAPHCDAGFLTLLPLSDVPGLEIYTTDDTWIPVPIIDCAILVNTGEFLNRWTNGRFRATPHRVGQVARERYTLTFFFNPSDDTVAGDIPTCVGPDNPSRFEPITLGEYREWYVKENFLHMRDGDA